MICTTCGKEFELSVSARNHRKQRKQPMDLCGHCAMVAHQNETNLKLYGTTRPLMNPDIRRKSEETCLRHWGTKNSMQNKTIKAKAEKTLFDHYGVKVPAKSSDIVKKMEDTYEQRTGYRHVFHNPEGKKKFVKTMNERHGVSYTAESSVLREKMEATLESTTGYKHALQNPESLQKAKNTMMGHYGVDHAFKLPEARRKARETIRRMFGGNSSVCDPGVRKKIEDACFLRYGVRCILQHPDIITRAHKGIEDKYGSKSCLSDPEVREKARMTKIARYGTPNPSIGMARASRSLEQKIAARLSEGTLSELFSFERDYWCENDGVSHHFDFAIFNKFDGTLNTLLDCDGLYWHAYKDNEYDGKSRETYDEERMRAMPPKVKFVIILEKEIDAGIIELAETLGIKYTQWEKDQFERCRNLRAFPYPNYKEESINKSYARLCKYYNDTDIPALKEAVRFARLGDHIISNYHRSIYHCRVDGRISPREAWDDDNLLKKCIRNRFIYINHVSPEKILQGFNVNKIAPRVSVFSAGRAKILINLYLKEFDIVFDPFSGFSGRMLGACAAGKTYIGHDANPLIVQESNTILRQLNLKAAVSVASADIEHGEYPCLFTCPPYGSKEKWWFGNDYIESEKTAEEWVDVCLANYKCEKYLFVVDSGCTKFDKYLVRKIENRSHFNSNCEKVLLIQ